MARYIDADKLLEELQEELDFKAPMYTGEQNEFFDRGLKCAIVSVEIQPTADVVEVKHGYIIEHQGAEDDYYCECSVCGTHEVSLGDKYCSECGAKLERKRIKLKSDNPEYWWNDVDYPPRAQFAVGV